MPTKQGDLALLDDPVAQELLRAPLPARLAYVWPDGTPRVVPIGYHWDGQDLVIGTPPGAPKVAALRRNPKVAITIDTDAFPCKVLLIRGTATLETEPGPIPEWVAAGKRMMGEELGTQVSEQLGALVPRMGGMVRVRVRPEWVGIIDFQTRLPSAVERAMAADDVPAPVAPGA
jgi:PPOX class probable F420-dependent enzyme